MPDACLARITIEGVYLLKYGTEGHLHHEAINHADLKMAVVEIPWFNRLLTSSGRKQFSKRPDKGLSFFGTYCTMLVMSFRCPIPSRCHLMTSLAKWSVYWTGTFDAVVVRNHHKPSLPKMAAFKRPGNKK